MECNHLWHGLYRQMQHSACCMKRRVLAAHLFLSKLLRSLGKLKETSLPWVLPQLKPTFVVSNQTQDGDGDGDIFYRPLCIHQMQIPDLKYFSFLFSFMKCIELNTSCGTWQIYSHTRYRIWEWLVLPGIGMLAGDDTQPFGSRQGRWVLPDWAPFSSLAAGSLSHVHKECIHLNDLSTLTEWKLEGRVPGCTWPPWIFPPSSAPGPKVNFAINFLSSISQERPTLTYSMRILLAKIGYYSE